MIPKTSQEDLNTWKMTNQEWKILISSLNNVKKLVNDLLSLDDEK